MGHDGGELVLVFGDRQQSLVHTDFPTRQGKCVDLFVREYADLPLLRLRRLVLIEYAGQGVGHAGNVAIYVGIPRKGRGLLQFLEGGNPHLRDLFIRKKNHLVPHQWRRSARTEEKQKKSTSGREADRRNDPPGESGCGKLLLRLPHLHARRQRLGPSPDSWRVACPQIETSAANTRPKRNRIQAMLRSMAAKPE